MFFKKQTTGADWLVAGLGNPGKKYEGTRHNVGFDAIDHLAKEWGVSVTKAKFEGLYGQAALGEGFVRCHRSYIVNLCRVRQIRKTDLLLDDGRTVPLARRAWPEVNRAFLALCREEIHEDP